MIGEAPARGLCLQLAAAAASWAAARASEAASRERVIRLSREITADWRHTDEEAIRIASVVLVRELAEADAEERAAGL